MWATHDADLRTLCAVDPSALFQKLESGPEGLHERDVSGRENATRRAQRDRSPWRSIAQIAVRQVRNPLILILVVAAIASLMLADWVEAALVLAVVIVTTVLGFAHEFVAHRAFEKLAAKVAARATVIRSGVTRTIPARHVVPGDVILLSAGDFIPADSILIASQGLYVNQSLITGETFPVRKAEGRYRSEDSLFKIPNCLLMGTSIESGTGRAIVFRTGRQTVFGGVRSALEQANTPSDFERSLNDFGSFLTRTMFIIVLSVLMANLAIGRPPLEMVMFAVALAVGLTPELLPAIVSVMLSKGARLFAKKGVIVRQLNAIENLGSMTVLCTDKTGTLTIGRSRLRQALDTDGNPSQAVLRIAAINAQLQTGRANPIDDAIQEAARHQGIDLRNVTRAGEIPLDFNRKRISVIAQLPNGDQQLLCKGALDQVLGCCTSIGAPSQPITSEHRAHFDHRHQEWASRGYRVLGVAMRTAEATDVDGDPRRESDLCFLGVLIFFDPLKTDAHDMVDQLHQRGVVLKIITGDDQHAARHAADWVGIPPAAVVTGAQLDKTNDQALVHLVRVSHVFAEVDPFQKKRIVIALQQSGAVVGFLGDGINDALALHAADVGISVSNAIDVAREASDFVLLKKELRLICDGIDEGRKIFVNTMKYIFSTTSANFGNMLSMAFVSVLIPFLPLLPAQILLNNLLSDLPAVTLTTDTVDPSLIRQPRRLHADSIRRYMIYFGLISALFDLVTFGVLLWATKVSEAEFRSAWFVESLLSELLVLLVIRTNLPLLKSKPSYWLILTSALVAIIACCLPYLSFGAVFGLVPLSAPVLLAMMAIALLYAATVQRLKVGHGLAESG